MYKCHKSARKLLLFAFLCVQISKIGNMVFKTKASGFQILAGSAGFLYPALAVGKWKSISRKKQATADKNCFIFCICMFSLLSKIFVLRN